MVESVETFTPEHENLLKNMWFKSMRKLRGASNGTLAYAVFLRQFHHWNWRYGSALYARNNSPLTLRIINASKSFIQKSHDQAR